MKILDFNYGIKTLYSLYQQGKYPSHLLYGMVELQKKGISIEYSSVSKMDGIRGIIKNTQIILNSKCDVVFLHYIFTKPLIGIAILKALKLSKIKTLGVSHTTIYTGKNSIERLYYKFLYRAFDQIFFHSPLNMEESLATGFITKEQTATLHWGVELDFYKEINKSTNKNNEFFISTGKENRDFNILLQSFSKTDFKLEIYTNKINFTQDYSFLLEYKQKFPNISINIIENNRLSMFELSKKSAESYCIVISLSKELCNYCVGHTSIVEALALGKPIIVSANDYHPIDVEKEHIGIKVKSSDPSDWIKAITYLYEHKEEAKIMGENGKRLAREKYNIEICANEILDSITSLSK
ncbi:Glycosyltransferase involved in cell wall bisynthesis [Bacteroides luti]|uniref:Glycosyltransferase involved in cell wall bisynthesis n=1 Tax=Bacteroides luti TaxID=1297750 RepID=A0A1M5BGS1_9BACE|nr:glycosyltransferase [Bacteroides luti]SHF41651.1 Glycosyltransferase involved in cell wall bisynthesis [Bacteroides luti]